MNTLAENTTAQTNTPAQTNTRTTPALRDAADLNTPPQLIAHKQAS